MGKVKAMLMDQQEEVQHQFIEGEIDARTCATELAKLMMEPDEIEVWIDQATAERALRASDKWLASVIKII